MTLAVRLLALGLGFTFILFPFYWTLTSSFTSEARLFEAPSLFPSHLVLDHYRTLFTERRFWVPIRNSLIVAGTTTFLCVTVGAFCAYALARLRFRGKRLILGLILAITMFPQISIVSPLYLLLRQLGLINTYPGLVLPYLTFAMPLTVWLLIGYFRQLPQEIEEAALTDGASGLRVFFEIVLPLSMPALATTAILDIRPLLERVPIRAFLHGWTRPSDRARRHRAISRSIPSTLGADPRRCRGCDPPGGSRGARISTAHRAGGSCRGQ